MCTPTQLSLFLNTGEGEKQTLLVISSAVSLPGPGSSLGAQLGSYPVPLGGGPPGACLCDWLGFFKGEGWEKGCGGKRGVHAGRGGGFHAASAVMLDVHPPGLLWTGMVADRMEGLLWEWSKFKF